MIDLKNEKEKVSLSGVRLARTDNLSQIEKKRNVMPVALLSVLFLAAILSASIETDSQAGYQYGDWNYYATSPSYVSCSEYASINSAMSSWSPYAVQSLCSGAYSVSSSAPGASIHNNLTSYVTSSTSYDDFFRIGYCKAISRYCPSLSSSSYSSSSSGSSYSSCLNASYFTDGGYCGASWVKTAMAASASSTDWYSAASYASKLRDWNYNSYRQQLGSQVDSVVSSLCYMSSYVGIRGSYIDENGNVKYDYSSGLCNGCPKGYLKGKDGRCHPIPQNCRIAAIDGNTTFCYASSGGCVNGASYDGFGGCASSLSSYSQNPSQDGNCDVNNDCPWHSWSSVLNGKCGGYSTYIDENGSTVEGIICADSGCPKGYAKTEDGRCKTLENTEGCNYVWAKGDRAYCGYCKSGYGKTPFGTCKPCSPGCANGCKSDDYTTCNSGGCKAGYSGSGCDTCTGGKYNQDGECVSSCGEGYYLVGSKCVKNPDGCASYNYSTGSCADCSGGNYLSGADCKANPTGCDSYNGTSCTQCSGGYYSDSGVCKANPTGCDVYSGTSCTQCSGGYLEKDGACITASNGCGQNYKDMGGWCNRIRYTPAEAAAVMNGDDNTITITFRK